eukprot:TRINITY_DN20676_c0_g1_i1.p1 TRINITY_DN20676_c0_g1~~TRINITY_DN20676_c0_g1_i1.p1  ORF type:complete len:185 (-),score=20.21 TRINITY_DN20676_c0_g1_i1:33-509(-)
MEEMTRMLQNELLKQKKNDNTTTYSSEPTSSSSVGGSPAAASSHSTGPAVPQVKTSAEMTAVLTQSSPTHPSTMPSSSGWTETVSVDSTQSPPLITIRLLAPAAVAGMKDVDLAAEPEYVDVNDHRVVLPCRLDVDSIKAKFVKSTRTLVVTGSAQQE